MFFANLLSGFATLFASECSNKCLVLIIDEPKCPKSLIK